MNTYRGRDQGTYIKTSWRYCFVGDLEYEYDGDILVAKLCRIISL
jgi:hypothetical protein